MNYRSIKRLCIVRRFIYEHENAVVRFLTGCLITCLFSFALLTIGLLTSCTSDSVFEEVQINKVRIAKYTSSEFYNACKDIINNHKDFEVFRDVLSKELLILADKQLYNEEQAVQIIESWYNDDICYDLMCEWPTWDDFKRLYPSKYIKLYSFKF